VLQTNGVILANCYISWWFAQ